MAGVSKRKIIVTKNPFSVYVRVFSLASMRFCLSIVLIASFRIMTAFRCSLLTFCVK